MTRDETVTALRCCAEGECHGCTIHNDKQRCQERVLKKISAADVAPVVYGRWGPGRFNLETGNYEAQCIRCRNFSKEYGKPYCPNCGAKMDGGKS